MADDKAPAESSTKPEANGAGPSTEQAKPAVEQLGALEEDDEFEVGIHGASSGSDELTPGRR